MARFMDQTDYVDLVFLDLVINIIGKRATALTWKAVRSNMIPPLPADDGSHRVLDPLMKVTTEAL
jgi:hypothetical protein